MDCEPFFALATDLLGDAWVRPERSVAGGQCVVDFFHPRTVERLGEDGIVTAFNRSGVVWAPPARRLGVQLRVPAAHDDATTAALAAAPFAFDRTDHRGASAPDGEMVRLLHYAVREPDVDDDDLRDTLRAVAAALDV